MNKSLAKSYLEGWRKTFVYKGKSTRKDFWSFVLINLFIIILVAAGSFFWLISFGTIGMVWIFFILCLLHIVWFFLLIPILSLGCRRMHDIEKSGWWFGGFTLFNVFGVPVFLALSGSILDKWLSVGTGKNVLIVIYIALSAVTFIIPIWLCCKPTKIKDLASPSDMTD